ncbi:DUF262 domain-containing protein [Sphingorhabdus sp. SMR4y]|uniref:DUF262 domain-containing protein n=1 Tax=Sphingorhabdus sp. SMR4y TaxID=2584094 RepID=UPI000B5C8780|nr:DUF262 domain-containing protein [Sphingorhabdus sp. SMR4y]ASK87261.1 hypothetical protein SPHFLASMR4Y_00475 [Sphingorhabdus sp. SMR4y]
MAEEKTPNYDADFVDRDEEFELDGPQEDSDGQTVTLADFDGLVLAPSDWTVGTIREQIGKQIDLDPDFQRRNVWSLRAKSKFVESVLLGVPIPQILLSSKENSRSAFLVLDGKQRLTAINEFMNGKTASNHKFKLRNLTILTELEGATWEDIRDKSDWGDRFLNATLRTAVLRGWNSEAVLYEIFHRLNSGSVRLSPMELRMSLHPGDFLKFIIKWTEDISSLHRLLKKKYPDARMNDVELCVRFLAFSDDQLLYDGNLKVFLDELAKIYNEKFQNSEFAQQVQDRLNVMNFAIDIGMNVFGPKNFCRKWLGERYEYRFNRALFDVLVGSLSHKRVSNWAQENPEQFESAFKELCSDSPKFIRYVEVTTKTNEATKGRFSLWYDKLEQASGIKLPIPNIK